MAKFVPVKFYGTTKDLQERILSCCSFICIMHLNYIWPKLHTIYMIHIDNTTIENSIVHNAKYTLRKKNQIIWNRHTTSHAPAKHWIIPWSRVIKQDTKSCRTMVQVIKPAHAGKNIALSPTFLPPRLTVHVASHDIVVKKMYHDDVIKWKHFCVTGHLRGEFTGHRWIPGIKASDAELWCFLWSAPEKRLSKQSWGWWFEKSSRPLWRHCNFLFIVIACIKKPVIYPSTVQ